MGKRKRKNPRKPSEQERARQRSEARAIKEARRDAAEFFAIVK